MEKQERKSRRRAAARKRRERRKKNDLTGWIIEFSKKVVVICALLVAPFAGAWIEISCSHQRKRKRSVALFAGAWIEI